MHRQYTEEREREREREKEMGERCLHRATRHLTLHLMPCIIGDVGVVPWILMTKGRPEALGDFL